MDAYLGWVFWRVEGAGFPVADYPRFADHFQRTAARPSFRRVMEIEDAATATLDAEGLAFGAPPVPARYPDCDRRNHRGRLPDSRRQTAALAAHEAMAGGGDPDALAAQALALGMGHVAGGHIPGLSAVAASIPDAFGDAATVITLVGTRDGIAPRATEQLRTAAAAASARLGSARLGWRVSETRATV